MPNLSHTLPANWFDCELSMLSQIAPLQRISHPRLCTKDIVLSIKREDLLDGEVGGNKFFKLYHFIKDWRATGGTQPLATFGGAYSNHLLAVAKTAAQLGVKSIGIVRGDSDQLLSPTLQDASNFGMQLVFVSRSDYRNKQDPAFLREMEASLGVVYWIPEGGAGSLGASGFKYLVDVIGATSSNMTVDAVCHACGTGTSLAGLIAHAQGVHIKGFSVLKGQKDLESGIDMTLNSLNVTNTNWSVQHEYHCGGYAKCPQYLVDFIDDFFQETGVLLDPVYTGKMMFGLFDQIANNCWQPGSHIVAIHSGGLQGRRGYKPFI